MADAKKVVYRETAVDGDKDGLVQDGTEFERPASKTKAELKVSRPEWFQELVDGTRVVTEQNEPEAVTRMRNV